MARGKSSDLFQVTIVSEFGALTKAMEITGKALQEMAKVTLLNDLRDQGIRLPPNHICVGGGCSISVTADPVYDRVLVTHRLGDRGSSQTFDGGLVGNSADEFSRMAVAALTKMHIKDGGIESPVRHVPKATPYISPNDAIKIATEIFDHTGQRVTIKSGGQKSRKSKDEPLWVGIDTAWGAHATAYVTEEPSPHIDCNCDECHRSPF